MKQKNFFKALIKWQNLVVAGILVVALLLGVLTIAPSKNKTINANNFSAQNAWAYLTEISKQPHSVFDQTELEQVRQYLTDTLSSFGINNHRVSHNTYECRNEQTGLNETIPVDNIYAEIPGTSGTYILLMAHYDSNPDPLIFPKPSTVGKSGASYGASDNMLGVATMLEIARVLSQSSKPLVNGIKFVFTDSEETTLGGAEALVNEYSAWISDVNLVINIDARGVSGPVFMFQTSGNNQKIIDFYSKAGIPFTFSLAAEVYSKLPNDTDFTPFLNAGFAGINFSVLEGLEYYHSSGDTIAHASKDTLQTYGDTILPLVKEYTSNSKYSSMNYFNSSQDAVFFTFIRGVFIKYSVTLSWILIVIAVIAVIALAVYLKTKKNFNIKKMLISLALWFGLLLAAAAGGLLVSFVLGLIFGKSFSLMNMFGIPFGLGFTIIFAVLLIALACFVFKLNKKLKINGDESLFAGVVLNTLFCLIFAFVLHGGTFLYLWPIILTLGVFAKSVFGNNKVAHGFELAFSWLTIFFVATLYVLIVYSFFVALTIGALCVILLLFSVPLAIVVPTIGRINESITQK